MATQPSRAPITWPPKDDISAEARDKELDQFLDVQIPLEHAIVFFLEIKTLMTGFRDRVTSTKFNGERNWCYSGLAKFPNCDTVDLT